ncbi:hypothetical protein LQF12_02115 [Ruania suaedae]|uniref:hypothetical protein n=1 Tax=Ruania suaedae TaxID=2897774 RepID=UPI001E5EBBFB|nr:hypothetical protein [Ruania suaedae]UFU03427.1 hypothetical protein LQF12_02115 [Ruania suaedae]
MPTFEPLPRWARTLGRAFHVASYLALTGVGVIGLTWPPGGVLAEWALIVTRIGGGLLITASLVAAVAAIRRRWLLELDVIPLVGLGLTAYGYVLLVYIGPQRWSLLVLGLIVTILSSLAGRGVVLASKVEERIRAKFAARRLAAHGGH